MSTWSKFGGFIYGTPYSGPEVVRLTEDGVDLTRRFSLSDVTAQGEYFHDFANDRLYVYPNADIAGIYTPKGNNRIYVAYFWVCLTNVQSQTNPITFIPQVGETYGATISCEYYPFLDANSNNSVTMNVAEYYQESVKMQFGQIKASNGAFWYTHKDDWIFINGIFYVKVGRVGDTYADYTNVFVGKLAEPKYTDNGISVACMDARHGILKSIPPDKFLEINHPNMNAEFIDTPIPILFGIKTNIKPVQLSNYDTADQWDVGGGDFESWENATTPTYWRTFTAGGGSANRDNVNQHGGTYCCRIDVPAGNETNAVRALEHTTASWFTYADGVWLDPGCGFALVFWYYMSVAAKTAEWSLTIFINEILNYWDAAAGEWTTVVTQNPLANALAYTQITEPFYLPEDAALYDSDETGTQRPLFFRFQNDSAASSSIYLDDFRIVSLATYKISQTVFNNDFAGRIALNAIDNVYQAGVEIFSPGDYLAYLDAGSFALTANPGSDEITCNAQGLKIQYDMTTGLIESPNIFSENVADILYFVLHILNSIPIANINLPDFLSLQSGRAQRLGWYLKDLTETIEFTKLLQRSAIFHYIINTDGQHTARFYRRSTTGDEPVIQNWDYVSYEFHPNTNSVFKTVVIKYGKAAMEDEYSVYSASEESVSYIYGEEKTLNSDSGVITALVAQVEVEALGTFYLSLVEQPPSKVTFMSIKPELLDRMPTDKIVLNRTVTDDTGAEISIHSEDIYSIISRQNNHRNFTTKITAGLDIHLAGLAQYGDVTEIDEHTDHDDHTDSVHVDVAHGDVAHQDHDDHDDAPYQDSHEDYTDYVDSHTDHTDAPSPHEDRYIDHTDNISEHVDDVYVDYTDHNDSHTDTPHEDGYADYTDHGDAHSDVPHVDSYL